MLMASHRRIRACGMASAFFTIGMVRSTMRRKRFPLYCGWTKVGAVLASFEP